MGEVAARFNKRHVSGELQRSSMAIIAGFHAGGVSSPTARAVRMSKLRNSGCAKFIRRAIVPSCPLSRACFKPEASTANVDSPGTPLPSQATSACANCGIPSEISWFCTLRASSSAMGAINVESRNTINGKASHSARIDARRCTFLNETIPSALV